MAKISLAGFKDPVRRPRYIVWTFVVVFALAAFVVSMLCLGGTAIAGGHGGPGRTVFGVLIISLLRVGLDIAGIDPAFQPIVYGIIVIVAIAVTVNRGRSAVVT